MTVKKDGSAKQVTIVDIARELNVTPSTVSRALRNHPDVNQQTKEKIVELAKALDYHPDSIARSLKKRSTNLIGVIVPQVRHSFFATVMAGITDVAEKDGYTILICQSNDEIEREKNNIRTLISQHIAGLLISVSKTTNRYEHFETLQKRKIPTVFFDRIWNDPRASKVIVDDYNGAYNAVNYLISKGYKKVAHLAGPKELSIGERRLQGYLDALRDHNIPINDEYIIIGGLNEEDGRKEIDKILDMQPENRPDAIFCVTDPVAIGAYIKIKKAKLKIPNDIALVGFSDSPEASLIDPPLTSVRQPAYEIGKEAIKLLIKQINNSDLIPMSKILHTKLIIRQST